MIEIKKEHGLDSGLDLTPLIDIIFIVLVFLLLTANPKLLSLPIEVPDISATTLSPQAQTQLTVSVLPQAPFWAPVRRVRAGTDSGAGRQSRTDLGRRRRQGGKSPAADAAAESAAAAGNKPDPGPDGTLNN